MPDVPRHLWVYRALFASAVVAMPLIGLQTWSLEGAYDPMGPRLLFAAFGLVALVATFMSARARRHARVMNVVLVATMCVFYLYVGRVNHWHTDEALGGVPPLLAILVLLLRTWRELGVAVLGVVCFVPLSYVGLEEPRFPMESLLVIYVGLSSVLGSLAVGRARLEQSLDASNRDLEERVAARTVELQDALTRLESEVEVRTMAEAAALAASRAKSSFLTNMSHELRTPLNAVIGYSEMMQDELMLLEEPELVDDSGRVLKAARHLLGVIDDLLDLTRIEAEELRVQTRTVDLGPVVREAVSLVESHAKARGNRIVVDLQDPRAQADPERLRQVLVNLLSNAASFTEGGTVRVVSRRDATHTCIEVRDNGVGIDPEDLEHVFQRFVQLDDSSTREHGGTGLGLPISRALVERMHGSLSATSAVGQGSTFQVRLPAAPAA